MTRFVNLLTASVASSVLLACGGGGGSTALTNSLGGVIAVGAPIANAQVSLVCGNGATQSTTADASGNYTFANLAGCLPPYVVKASGDVGGTQESYVSVLPTEVSGAANLNVTPITHAIAATLASDGDPLKLVNDLSAERTRITDAAVTARVNALKASLSGILTAAGLANDFDLLKSKFTANGTGFDKVLDNLKIDVKSTGVVIANAAGNVVDDMGNLGAAPQQDFSASAITISNATNFSSVLTALPSVAIATCGGGRTSRCSSGARRIRG